MKLNYNVKVRGLKHMNIGQKVLFELKKEISEIEYERYIKNLSMMQNIPAQILSIFLHPI